MFFKDTMKIYHVYVRQGVSDPLETTLFIRDGFSFFAFLFNIFWALFHRMWLVAGGYFLLVCSVVWLQQQGILSEPSVLVLEFAMMLVMGMNAPDWYGKVLEKRRYVLKDVVTGHNLLEAQQRFFDRYATFLRNQEGGKRPSAFTTPLVT